MITGKPASPAIPRRWQTRGNPEGQQGRTGGSVLNPHPPPSRTSRPSSPGGHHRTRGRRTTRPARHPPAAQHPEGRGGGEAIWDGGSPEILNPPPPPGENGHRRDGAPPEAGRPNTGRQAHQPARFARTGQKPGRIKPFCGHRNIRPALGGLPSGGFGGKPSGHPPIPGGGKQPSAEAATGRTRGRPPDGGRSVLNPPQREAHTGDIRRFENPPRTGRPGKRGRQGQISGHPATRHHRKEPSAAARHPPV